jgi:hypothetical protein
MDPQAPNTNDNDNKPIIMPPSEPETAAPIPPSPRPELVHVPSYDSGITANNSDPYSLANSKKEDISIATLRREHPASKRTRQVKKIKSYYNRQNALIDAYLGSNDEEAAEAEDTLQNGGKVKFAVNASFTVNFCLFIIQVYAAVSTGSLALFATAADAFVSLQPHG